LVEIEALARPRRSSSAPSRPASITPGCRTRSSSRGTSGPLWRWRPSRPPASCSAPTSPTRSPAIPP
jgi:hypothetical protein